MKKYIIGVCLLICLTNTYAQNKKKVLLIGIGLVDDSWTRPHTKNGIGALQESLKTQGYDEITVLLSQKDIGVQAYKISKTEDYKPISLGYTDLKIGNIRKALTTFGDNLKPGDEALFHWNGHCFQMQDTSGDETIDGLDEAFVLEDTKQSGKTLVTRPIFDSIAQTVLLDDELSTFVGTWRKNVGIKGRVILSFDTCHSGGGTRGNEHKATDENEPITYGGKPLIFNNAVLPPQNKKTINTYFDTDLFNSNNKKNLGAVVVYAAASMDTEAPEITAIDKNNYGFWTYALAKALQNNTSILETTNIMRNAQCRYNYYTNSRLSPKQVAIQEAVGKDWKGPAVITTAPRQVYKIVKIGDADSECGKKDIKRGNNEDFYVYTQPDDGEITIFILNNDTTFYYFAIIEKRGDTIEIDYPKVGSQATSALKITAISTKQTWIIGDRSQSEYFYLPPEDTVAININPTQKSYTLCVLVSEKPIDWFKDSFNIITKKEYDEVINSHNTSLKYTKAIEFK